MSTSQDLRDAADAVVTARAAMLAAQANSSAAVIAATAAANASPEGIALAAASADYQLVLDAEYANADVNALGAIASDALTTYNSALTALQEAIASYDGQ